MIIKPNTPRSSIHFPDIYSRKKLNTLYREVLLKDTVFRTLRKCSWLIKKQNKTRQDKDSQPRRYSVQPMADSRTGGSRQR